MKIPSRAKWYYRVAGISGVLIAAAHRPTLSSEVPRCSCNSRHWATIAENLVSKRKSRLGCGFHA